MKRTIAAVVTTVAALFSVASNATMILEAGFTDRLVAAMPDANQIFIVNDAPRTKISTK